MNTCRRRAVALLWGVVFAIISLCVVDGICYVLLQTSFRPRLGKPSNSVPPNLYETMMKYSMAVPTTTSDRESRWTTKAMPIFNDTERPIAENVVVGGAMLGLKPGFRFRDRSVSRAHGVVFDVPVAIDEWGWRKSKENARARFHFIGMGCSYTFGEGVGDEETYPSFVSSLAPAYAGYNLGISGSSVAGMLARMQLGPWNEGIPQAKGVAVYMFITDHILRAQSLWNGTGLGALQQPFLEDLGGDQFKFRESNERAHPVKAFFVRLFLRTHIVKFFDLNRQARWSEEELDRFTRMILAARNEYLRKYPEGKFYFVFYPGEDVAAFRLAPYLEKYKIHFLYYQPNIILRLSDSPPFIYGNGHPTANSHRIMAELLIKDLHLNDEH